MNQLAQRWRTTLRQLVQAQQSAMSLFITSAGSGKGGDLGGL